MAGFFGARAFLARLFGGRFFGGAEDVIDFEGIAPEHVLAAAPFPDLRAPAAPALPASLFVDLRVAPLADTCLAARAVRDLEAAALALVLPSGAPADLTASATTTVLASVVHADLRAEAS